MVVAKVMKLDLDLVDITSTRKMIMALHSKCQQLNLLLFKLEHQGNQNQEISKKET